MPRPSGLRIIRRYHQTTGAPDGFTITGSIAGIRVRRRAQSNDARLAREEAATLEAEALRTAWHGERCDAPALIYPEAAPLSLDDIRRLPSTQVGVYFLFLRGRLQRIGQSTDITKRIARHRRNGLRFDDCRILHCAPDQLLMLESLYITKFRPPHNHELTRSMRAAVRMGGITGTIPAASTGISPICHAETTTDPHCRSISGAELDIHQGVADATL